tara:strand:+ start:21622 stop:21813 length:192 start_codon:yes stop_codon:yes gene_type:complete
MAGKDLPVVLVEQNISPGGMFLYLGTSKSHDHGTQHAFFLVGFGQIELYGRDLCFLKEIKNTP